MKTDQKACCIKFAVFSVVFLAIFFAAFLDCIFSCFAPPQPPPGPSASPLSLVPALERLVADRQWRVAAALTARLLARDPAAASAAEGDGHPAAVLASSAVQRAQRAPRLPWRLEAVAQFHRLCVSLLAAPGCGRGRGLWRGPCVFAAFGSGHSWHAC